MNLSISLKRFSLKIEKLIIYSSFLDNLKRIKTKKII